jgi:hypothetical protein
MLGDPTMFAESAGAVPEASVTWIIASGVAMLAWSCFVRRLAVARK